MLLGETEISELSAEIGLFRVPNGHLTHDSESSLETTVSRDET